MIDGAALTNALGRPVAGVRRMPYEYRTSHAIEVLEVALEDGTSVQLLLKHLARTYLSADAQQAKPESLHEPEREIEAYSLLSQAGLGTPACYAAGADWLLLEKVPGVELWQVGDLGVWARVASWLAGMHAQFAGAKTETAHFVDYDARWFRRWVEHALARDSRLKSIAGRCEPVIERLIAQPRTLVHGEFYPSNVLVAGDRVAAVDWEMAGTGPGVLDLAALVTGWRGEERKRIVDAYGAVPSKDLEAARLLIALHWLGRAVWTPPPEHAQDWFAEAMESAELLDL